MVPLVLSLVGCASAPPRSESASPLEQCRTAFADLSLAHLTREADQRAIRGEAAMRAGEPQPGAERAVAPLLAGYCQPYGPARSEKLECRTGVCKLTTVAVKGPPVPGPDRPIPQEI